eukprot:ANDGO_03561.mRNA.1 Dpy-30 motif protein
MLRLHFDINQTILVQDLAGGKSTEDCINGMIANELDGYVDEHNKWHPVFSNEKKVKVTLPLITYHRYLKDYAYPMKHGDPIHNASMKNLQSFEIRRFFDCGHPGHALAHMRQPIVEKLLKPEYKIARTNTDVRRQTRKSTADRIKEHQKEKEKEKEKEKVVFPDDAFQILLSSFLRVFDQLDGVPFRLVLRTFGDDLERICDAVNTHLEERIAAVASSSDRSPSEADRLAVYRFMNAEQHGFFLRYDSDRVLLCMGHRLRPANLGFHDADATADSIKAALASHPDTIHLFDGFSQVFHGLHMLCDKYGSLALRDDYDFWRHCAEGPRGGKLLIVAEEMATELQQLAELEERTPKRKKQSAGSRNAKRHGRHANGNGAQDCDEHQQNVDIDIFFDDNIQDEPDVWNERNIVDCRTETGRKVPYEVSTNRVLFHVDTMQAVLNDDYFIASVRQTLDAHKSSKSLLSQSTSPQ